MAAMTPFCRNIRRNILMASRASGHGHIPTSFSVIEMVCAAYDILRHDPKNPQWPERDIFILSKGHAALGFYAVLAQYGYFPAEELKTFGAFQSRLGCHPGPAESSGRGGFHRLARPRHRRGRRHGAGLQNRRVAAPGRDAHRRW